MEECGWWTNLQKPPPNHEGTELISRACPKVLIFPTILLMPKALFWNFSSSTPSYNHNPPFIANLNFLNQSSIKKKNSISISLPDSASFPKPWAGPLKLNHVYDSATSADIRAFVSKICSEKMKPAIRELIIIDRFSESLWKSEESLPNFCSKSLLPLS